MSYLVAVLGEDVSLFLKSSGHGLILLLLSDGSLKPHLKVNVYQQFMATVVKKLHGLKKN